MALLEKLEQTDVRSPEWLKTFKKLPEENEHPTEEEEKEVFELARKPFDQARLAERGEAFESWKRREPED